MLLCLNDKWEREKRLTGAQRARGACPEDGQADEILPVPLLLQAWPPQPLTPHCSKNHSLASACPEAERVLVQKSLYLLSRGLGYPPVLAGPWQMLG